MIVVNRARKAIGQEIEVTIASVLQTAAGRMAFAEIANGHANGNSHVEAELLAEESAKLAPVN
jgi:hypothetical protein